MEAFGALVTMAMMAFTMILGIVLVVMQFKLFSIHSELQVIRKFLEANINKLDSRG